MSASCESVCRVACAVLVALLAACGDEGRSQPGGGGGGGGRGDALVRDGGGADAGGAVDAGARDAALVRDAAGTDAVARDVSGLDAVSPDALVADAFAGDGLARDAGSADAVSRDATSPDAFAPDAAPPGPTAAQCLEGWRGYAGACPAPIIHRSYVANGCVGTTGWFVEGENFQLDQHNTGIADYGPQSFGANGNQRHWNVIETQLLCVTVAAQFRDTWVGHEIYVVNPDGKRSNSVVVSDYLSGVPPRDAGPRD